MCPHPPEHDCDCRKPKPGLLLQAARELEHDLGASVLIGDALTDILAARAAGVGEVEFVLTGRGREQRDAAQAESLRPFRVFPDLTQALHSRPNR
jgi:D-glycero-D-manno-heptose 1,7-bisphosphate phosphatase